MAKLAPPAIAGEIIGHGSDFRQLHVRLTTGQEILAALPKTRKFGCLFGSLVGWTVKVVMRPSPKPARVIDLARSIPTMESLRRDQGYRFNDNITDALTKEALWVYLTQEAETLDRVREFEVSYGIYREIVWRFPDRPAAWEGLAKYAAKMGLHNESRVAQSEMDRLNGAAQS